MEHLHKHVHSLIQWRNIGKQAGKQHIWLTKGYFNAQPDRMHWVIMCDVVSLVAQGEDSWEHKRQCWRKFLCLLFNQTFSMTLPNPVHLSSVFTVRFQLADNKQRSWIQRLTNSDNTDTKRMRLCTPTHLSNCESSRQSAGKKQGEWQSDGLETKKQKWLVRWELR